MFCISKISWLIFYHNHSLLQAQLYRRKDQCVGFGSHFLCYLKSVCHSVMALLPERNFQSKVFK